MGEAKYEFGCTIAVQRAMSGREEFRTTGLQDSWDGYREWQDRTEALATVQLRCRGCFGLLSMSEVNNSFPVLGGPIPTPPDLLSMTVPAEYRCDYCNTTEYSQCPGWTKQSVPPPLNGVQCRPGQWRLLPCRPVCGSCLDEHGLIVRDSCGAGMKKDDIDGDRTYYVPACYFCPRCHQPGGRSVQVRRGFGSQNVRCPGM